LRNAVQKFCGLGKSIEREHQRQRLLLATPASDTDLRFVK
jgi:hypothetical protein